MRRDKVGAGDLRQSLAFQKRGDGNDGYGGVTPGTGPFATVYTVPCHIDIEDGTEAVLGGQLQGKLTARITCRWSKGLADALDNAWRLVDANQKLLWSVKSSDKGNGQNDWIVILAQGAVYKTLPT